MILLVGVLDVSWISMIGQRVGTRSNDVYPSLSAKRSEKTSLSNIDGYGYEHQQPVTVKLLIGGSLTFDDVNVEEAGEYWLSIYSGFTDGVIIDIIVNGNLYKKIDKMEDRAANSMDTVQLNNGNNTIQLILDESTPCGTFRCPDVIINNITVDKT